MRPSAGEKPEAAFTEASSEIAFSGSATPRLASVIGRPSSGASMRHPHDFVDEGAETRIVAARGDDQRQDDALFGRRDAPAAGETGEIGLRAGLGGWQRMAAALRLAPRTRSEPPPANIA